MVEEKKPGAKPLDILGGSLLLKILLLLAVGLIVSVIFFGVKLTPLDLFWASAKIFLGIIIIILIFKGIQTFFAKASYSPTEDFKVKITNIAKACKPWNVHNLFLRGEDMRIYSKFGKIIGMAFIPYFASVEEKDDKGQLIMVEKRNLQGMVEKDEKTGKSIMIPKMKIITEKDGDWLFIVRTGALLFGKEHMVRVAKDLCSEIMADIWVKDVNFFPIGHYLYPAKQCQEMIKRILTQHHSEALIQTHEHFLDLMATTTEMSLGSNPFFQEMMHAQSEALSRERTGALVR